MPYKNPIDAKNYYYEHQEQILKQKKLHARSIPWIMTFRKIKQRCENPNCAGYFKYGGRGIKCLITEEELKFLWFRDKAYLMEKPTIDRKDNDGNYEISNCQYLERYLNCSKDKKKQILQIDLSGNIIKIHESLSAASKYIHRSIGSLCLCTQGKRNSCGGFTWKYK